MEKDVHQLDGVWQFKEFPETARRIRDLDGGGWMTAAVPASIYTCLIEAGIIDRKQLNADPEDFRWVNDKSWLFRKTFDIPEALLKKEHIRLIFEGLDTVCRIWVNGKLIGKSENMFIPHAFDITDRLEPSTNVLMVKFSPAPGYAEQLMQRYGRLSEHHFGDVRRSYIRKAQYHFGSVMGPALVGCGIFRSIRIEGVNAARIKHLHIRTVDCNQHFADIRVAVALERIEDTSTPLHAKIHLTGGGLDITQAIKFSPKEDRHATLLHIERPILWWPNGYGVQHQYHLKVELYRDTCLLDTTESNIGIRTIRLNRSADGVGTKFQFLVNEQPIQVKGANWMPLSLLPGSQTRGDYKFMLARAADAHFNMLRVWAGGFYENPDFYQLCDELGILVWQDFMFVSAYYPDRRWFQDIVSREARIIIEQLRNHPSLALWCGNSRIDSLHEAGRLGKGRKFYGKAIYHTLIPSLLSELDPDREYIPTTPFSESHPAASHHDPASGTTHNWHVWNQYGDRADYETSREHTPRFVAEFGLQSLPDMETLSLFGSTRTLTAGSFAIEKHNYQPGGQQRIARYVADDFVPSSDLKKAVWQSQVTQARAVKGYVEHLRSHNSINSGCLIWTLNEPAPSVSFSMIDALKKPKALYYYARRFFAPVLLTLTPGRLAASHSITVINDGPLHITATLDCRILDFAGALRDRIQLPIALSPYSRSPLYPVPKSYTRSLDTKTSFLHLQLCNDGATIAENFYFFEPDKYLAYIPGDVELEINAGETDRLQVTLRAETVIRDLQIIPPRRSRLSDNFITLLPGRTQSIEMLFEGPAPPVHTPIQILCAGRS